MLTCYPGIHALIFHRVAHAGWRRGHRWFGRLVSQIGRFMTGIELHPGATIGRRVFIDHGMGVVVGETAIFGDDPVLLAMHRLIDHAKEAQRVDEVVAALEGHTLEQTG